MSLDQWGFAHWFDRLPNEERAHLPTDINSFGRITGIHRKRIDVQTAAGFETVDFQVANKATSNSRWRLGRARYSARQTADYYQDLLQNLFTIQNSLRAPKDAAAACKQCRPRVHPCRDGSNV